MLLFDPGCLRHIGTLNTSSNWIAFSLIFLCASCVIQLELDNTNQTRMIGKRKRDSVVYTPSRLSSKSSAAAQDTDSKSHDIFRKHFEASFRALLVPPEQEANNLEERDAIDGGTNDQASDWNGLSDAEEHPAVVEVVHYAKEIQDHEGKLDKARAKAFMVKQTS